MLISATVVVDRLDLVLRPVRGILLSIDVRCVLVNSSGDKSEYFVIP